MPFTPPGLSGRKDFPANTNAPKGPHRFSRQRPPADDAGGATTVPRGCVADWGVMQEEKGFSRYLGAVCTTMSYDGHHEGPDRTSPLGHWERAVRRYAMVCCVLVTILLLGHHRPTLAAPYDPLSTTSGTARARDFTVTDKKRDREIPVRVYFPDRGTPAPVVLFSHGLGGSRKGGSYLGKHWSARGYMAVFVQHPGSDTSVWKDEPRHKRMAAMRRAANGRNFMLRVKDIPAVLDQLDRWNSGTGHPLSGRLDLKHVGMAGHSFGAVTTQAVSGQAFMGRQLFTDERIKAAIAFSPSSPRRGRPEHAFGQVDLPWMLMTGTKDVAVIGDADLQSRLGVFPALPAGDKYELVLHRAEHSAFTDRSLPGDTEERNPNHHRAILALSTAFWDACLQKNGAAEQWLNGHGPRSVLEPEDRWQKK